MIADYDDQDVCDADDEVVKRIGKPLWLKVIRRPRSRCRSWWPKKNWFSFFHEGRILDLAKKVETGSPLFPS